MSFQIYVLRTLIKVSTSILWTKNLHELVVIKEVPWIWIEILLQVNAAKPLYRVCLPCGINYPKKNETTVEFTRETTWWRGMAKQLQRLTLSHIFLIHYPSQNKTTHCITEKYMYTLKSTHTRSSVTRDSWLDTKPQATITNDSWRDLVPNSVRFATALRPSNVRSKCRCPDGMHIGQKEVPCSALGRIECHIKNGSRIYLHTISTGCLIIRVKCTRSYWTGVVRFYSLFSFANHRLYFTDEK